MNRVALAICGALALAGCTSAPEPEQAVDLDRAPCAGEGFEGGPRTYARCIRHVAAPRYAMRQIHAGMHEHRRLITGDGSTEKRPAD